MGGSQGKWGCGVEEGDLVIVRVVGLREAGAHSLLD